jgi:hypothetical protein
MKKQERIAVALDGPTRICLWAIAALLTVLAVGLWAEAPVASNATAAEQPRGFDAASQRQAILEAQQETNRKLGELIDVLRSGQMKVQLAAEAGAAGESGATTKRGK